MRAATYGRVSTDDQSLDLQTDRLAAYIRLRGMEHAGHFEDPGISGGTMERPGLRALVDQVRAGSVDAVVVWKLDRISRSLRDFLELLALFEEHGVAFQSINESIDTKSPAGRMLVHVLMAFAEFERETIVERTKAKLAHRAELGKWNGGTPPLGYKRKDKRLVADPKAARIVRRVFEWYLELQSTRLVAQRLDKRHPQARKWGMSRIAHILRNPVYIGRVRYGGEVYQGEHEALVAETDWRQAQELLDQNQITNNSKKRKRSHRLALAGVAVCPNGRKLSVKFSYRSGKRYDYLACTGRACGCGTKAVNGAKLEGYLLDLIDDAVGCDASMIAALERVEKATTRDRQQWREDLADLRARRTELEATARKILGAFSDLTLAREELARMEAERAALDARIEELEAELAAEETDPPDAGQLRAYLDDVRLLWEDATIEERRELAALVFDDVQWHGTHVKATLRGGMVTRIPTGAGARSRVGCDSPGPTRRRVQLGLRVVRDPAPAPKRRRGKLTAAQVREIRARLAAPEPETYREIGARFGVSAVTVHKIAAGKTWAA